jgi:5-carboxymethyl-2-hydroxymuconate isomerase
MPHLTLEYSANIDQEIRADDLFSELHQALASLANLNVENCKGRLVRLEDTYIGRGEPQNAFVHLDIRLLAGRAPELKRRIGQHCLRFLEDYFAPSTADRQLQITVEIVDIQPEAYFKVPAGTLEWID